ncbi:hypothetical protein J437_LFUL014643 [Ladona fulva]|uniref:Uncharacterized protein n=1 Tax=Ladona fulva TaxID=123851 RepID=A0A8K0P3H3_LADFU|nr:hypothetical protein J437_LFUL014643 [Ladona fulva]
MARDDFRELIELSVPCTRFLGFREHDQFKITSKDKAALLEVCLFIVTSYVKPWFQCILAVKASYQDLYFLKSMKTYEKIDKSVAKAASFIYA